MKLLAIFLLALMGFLEIASGAVITGVSDDLTGSAVAGDCHNGDEKCSILPIILLGRHSIKRCINHNWVDHEICNAGVICTADPSPHCTIATINGEIADKDKTSAVAANGISSRQQTCLEGSQQCAYLDPIKRHIIQRCYGRKWVNTKICEANETCTGGAAPQCVAQAVLARDMTSAVDCRQGIQQCAYLHPIHRYIIQRCNGHKWDNIKVCEATETCIGGDAPQCVAQTVLSRDETNEENTDEENTDEDGIDADSPHKADLPCTKCKRMRDDCFRNHKCRTNYCRHECLNRMKRYLVEDGRHGRYRGTCQDYCPQLCR